MAAETIYGMHAVRMMLERNPARVVRVLATERRDDARMRAIEELARAQQLPLERTEAARTPTRGGSPMSTQMPTGAPPGVPESLITPQGNVPAIGIGTSQDYARLVYAAPYFTTVAIAEIIEPSVTEAVENVLPSLIPPYVDSAVLAGIQQYAVLLTGSTMSGPLFLNPLMGNRCGP